MEKRQLGESGVFVSPITFGAWSIGPWDPGSADPVDAIKAIRQAYEIGSTSIDTGAGYGLGFSEEIVAEAYSGIPRDRVQILTKCGVVWEGNKGQFVAENLNYKGRTATNGGLVNFHNYAGKESIIRECERSLRRLKTDYIDLYSIHFTDPTTPIEESMEAFVRLKEQGKIRAAGICNHSLENVERAEQVFSLASYKMRYSMLHREIEQDLIPFCLQHKKSVLAYCVLQRGVLTGKDVPQHKWSVGAREEALHTPENQWLIKDFLGKIAPIANDYGVTLTQFCIRWVIDRPGVGVALLAATTPEQVVEDAKAIHISLRQADMQLIDGYWTDLQEKLLVAPELA